MAKDKYAQALNTPTVTQTAADTTTVVEVALPNIPETGHVMAISKISWGPFTIMNLDGAWHQMTLATRGDIASGDLTIAHPSVVALMEIESRFVTSGLAVYEMQPNEEIWTPEFLLAHRKIYLYVTSAATGQVNKARARIWFRFVKVSVEEFMQVFADYEG